MNERKLLQVVIDNKLGKELAQLLYDTKKELFDDIERNLFHRDKEHFEYNLSATFKKLEELKKKHLGKQLIEV